MIIVPHIDITAGQWRYADTHDPALRYVDGAASGRARWMPAPRERALLAGEVRFGGAGLPAAAGLRHVPMPWGPGPVFVWARVGDGVALVARGRTSGTGGHHAVVSAEAHAKLIIAPLRAAAELSCPAILKGAAVRITGDGAALVAALADAPTGARAAWDATLADALLSALHAAESRGALDITVEAAGDPGEPRALALLELARRIAAACRLDSLAAPAALAPPLALPAPPDARLDWRDGDRVTVRAVRAAALPAEVV